MKAKTSTNKPSICRYLPWMEYDDTHRCFILQDQTIAALFELDTVASEARAPEQLKKLRDGLQGVFQDVFPQYGDKDSPWIVQCYVQDELSLHCLAKTVADYAKKHGKDHAQTNSFTQDYLALFNDHCQWMSRPEGMFVDDKVSGQVFRAGQRKVRMVIYRRYRPKMTLTAGRSRFDDLDQVSNSLLKKLKAAGVNAARCAGEDFYAWMLRWFNPRPVITKGSVDALLKTAPYPQAKEKPWGYDVSEQLFFSVPKSDEQKSVWYFDELPHRYLSIQQLTRVPEIGQLTAERQFGNFYYGLFDQLPEGSVWVMSMVMQSQETVKNHLDRIEHTARKSRSTAASITVEDCQIAKAALENNNYLFPTQMGVYLRGNDLSDLEAKQSDVEALLVSHGFHVLHQDHELLPIHSYLMTLPMCYNNRQDQQFFYRSQYVFGKQLANLLPVYGRERGTLHPGIVGLNRGGEPFMIDPLNPEDKDNNSFLLLLGASGAGKSAMSIYLLMHMMAMHHPYLVITDAGLSFGLLTEYFHSQGLQVHRVEISVDDPPVLNPFAESLNMLKQFEGEAATKTQVETDEETAVRDYLGEMSLACQLMITGGEKNELTQLTRQDRLFIVEALIYAAKASQKAGHTQMIAADVVSAFQAKAAQLSTTNQESEKVLRLKKMADSLQYFCQDALSSKIFNQRGKPWPDADVILFEQGIFKDEGYEAHNVLAFMGLMNRTLSRVEQRQYQLRETIFFIDEAHTLLKNSLTAVYLTKGAKMARKLGLWFWLATQNISDFAADAKKILSMIEFWVCLGMSEAELSQIEAFRPLTEEEKRLFRSVRKSNKKYVEAVLLCHRLKALFRNIPPRLALALAMTEKHEKAQRQTIMQAKNITELEAAFEVAKGLSAN